MERHIKSSCALRCCLLKVMSKPDYRAMYNSSLDTCANDDDVKSKKAGIVAICNDRILIVQSCSSYWGAPKGSGKVGETAKQTAIREFEEETGLHLTEDELRTRVRIDQTVYFLVRFDTEVPVDVQYVPLGEWNDATGIGWIALGCVLSSNLKVNNALRRIMSHRVFRAFTDSAKVSKYDSCVVRSHSMPELHDTASGIASDWRSGGGNTRFTKI